ncbi:RNA polymerase sigma factor [Sphingosinicella sp. CPCC 101087]|uniref:RNA polymerase sigma factor n=1 Tax=Sphingosinicella sp. CPCC 101087 TaxID=2497754 RepID=UPI00101E1761|nr:RNA polymerase sigma factor [Sphingosinicella sp. CPCC 101087]
MSSAPPPESVDDENNDPCRNHPSETSGAERRRVELLYREQAARLRRQVGSRLRCSEEARDLVQDAFARLLRAGAGQGLRRPEAFLGRIVRNLLIDRSRRLRTRAVQVPLEDAPELSAPPGQYEDMELEDMRSRYRAAVATLPPRMRQVFVLHRIEGLGYKTIAERLGISVRTVEWHMAEAIVRIGSELDKR